MELALEGKVVAVTGGSRGIGLAIARAAAAEGAGVAIGARDPAALEAARATLAATGARVYARAGDLTDPSAIRDFLEGAAAALGGLAHLVANMGGVVGRTPFLDTPPESWRATFELNLFAAVEAIRVAAPLMCAEDDPSVVIVSSISGWKPGPRPHYGAAKAAEIHLAGSLAWELAPLGIRVNAISPGSIRFPGGNWERTAASRPDDYRRFEAEEFPAGRLGTAEEVADAAVFLLSRRARWINGANVPIDGGQGRPSI